MPFRHMALSQDKIGSRGDDTTEITSIQRQYIAVNGSPMSAKENEALLCMGR